MAEHKHIECISDFCGNYNSPGHWADIYEEIDGTRYIALGGAWQYYHPEAPERIESSDPRYDGFVAACNEGNDINYIRNNWK